MCAVLHYVYYLRKMHQKIQYLQSCVCAENLIYSYKHPQKLLPPALLLFRQICTKSFAGWGFAPDPTGRAYSAPPNPLAGLGGGPPGKGKEKRGRERKAGEEKGKERERSPTPPDFSDGLSPSIKSQIRPMDKIGTRQGYTSVQRTQ